MVIWYVDPDGREGCNSQIGLPIDSPPCGHMRDGNIFELGMKLALVELLLIWRARWVSY